MAEWLRRLTRNQMGSSRVGSNPTRSVGLFEFFKGEMISKKTLHCRGIEPRSPAWQARILPLNQQCVSSRANQIWVTRSIIYIVCRKTLHCRGIEPRSPAWQARILPLNQQCLRGSILPLRVDISLSKKTLGFSRKLTTMGIEPTIFRFEVGRLIHWATRPMQEWKYYCLMYNKTKFMISKYGKWCRMFDLVSTMYPCVPAIDTSFQRTDMNVDDGSFWSKSRSQQTSCDGRVVKAFD